MGIVTFTEIGTGRLIDIDTNIVFIRSLLTPELTATASSDWRRSAHHASRPRP